jgi:curved DNA-binding protein CbpA
MAPSPDPYRTLGVARSATDAEIRAAYRRLVQLHHPDHNGGSVDSARRFEAVQDAYAEVRRLRAAGGPGAAGGGASGPAAGRGAAGRSAAGSAAGRSAAGSAAGGTDPHLDARLAAMEQELARAREAREVAAREARRATEQTIRDVRAMAGDRPSDEDLGYYKTEDSFSRILDDAAAELGERFTEARDSPAGHRVSDLIDELTSKLTGEHKPSDK